MHVTLTSQVLPYRGRDCVCVCVMTLPGAASLYLLGSEDEQLYEVKAFSEDYHSWFIGQTVQRG